MSVAATLHLGQPKDVTQRAKLWPTYVVWSGEYPLPVNGSSR